MGNGEMRTSAEAPGTPEPGSDGGRNTGRDAGAGARHGGGVTGTPPSGLTRAEDSAAGAHRALPTVGQNRKCCRSCGRRSGDPKNLNADHPAPSSPSSGGSSKRSESSCLRPAHGSATPPSVTGGRAVKKTRSVQTTGCRSAAKGRTSWHRPQHRWPRGHRAQCTKPVIKTHIVTPPL